MGHKEDKRHRGEKGTQRTQGTQRDTGDTRGHKGHRGHSELLLLYAVSLLFASCLTQYLFSACAIEPDLLLIGRFSQ